MPTASRDPQRTNSLGGFPVRFLLVPAIVAVALAWSSSGAQRTPVLVTEAGVTTLSPPRALPAFTLEAADAAPLTPRSFQGHWTLVSIGFASCPDICPNTLGVLARAIEAIPEARVLFVSVDPERDSPERLRAYAAHFGDRVVGATGSHEAIRAFTKPLGLFYRRDDDGGPHYSVEHSTTTLVVDPDGEIVALLSPEALDAETLARKLDTLRGRG